MTILKGPGGLRGALVGERDDAPWLVSTGSETGCSVCEPRWQWPPRRPDQDGG